MNFSSINREYIDYQALKNSQIKIWNISESYEISNDLSEAINVALYLRRPLLLEGEPGCGKTRLAYALAYELELPLVECYIQSSSQSVDFLYQYDALARLHDAQIKEKTDLPEAIHYITLKKLGKVIELAENDIPFVVLIDEIDKANEDFPNDLLRILDNLKFEIKEIRESGKNKHEEKIKPSYDGLKQQKREERKKYLPLIIITSNREKKLPKAFLRRCIYHYVNFPDNKLLNRIVKCHFQLDKSTPLLEAAILKFWEIRTSKEIQWFKPPGTSELLDWLNILQYKNYDSQTLANIPIKDLPHFGTLFKMYGDIDLLKESS